MTDKHGTGKRLYAQPSSSPSLVIKTNLDPKSPEEENPYYTHKRDEKFNQYFK
ncbi:hypothetical protein [Priestia abyssalis]|uniref:hypothetical protein n=1 Tax=Priestia abyssalis TaxID=1221450 RepID=UPI001472C1BD|nr:hypothetical protein [Priestia abyssalis]